MNYAVGKSVGSCLRRAAVAALGACAVFASGGAWAATRIVPTDGTLEEALAASADGDAIEIAAGTYTLAAAGTYTLIDKAVTIRGTGDTAADVVIKANDTQTFRCFFVVSNELARIENVTLTGAYNNSDDKTYDKSWRNSSLLLYEGTLKDCVIRDNYQRDIGTVRQFGGLVTGCTFSKNYSYSNSSHGYGYGGALFQQDGVVSNCLFTSNEARLNGGAAIVRGGLLTHSTFSGNKIERNKGAAVVVTGGTVSHCHFTGNGYIANSQVSGCCGAVSVWRGELVDCDICTNIVAKTTGGGVTVVSADYSINCEGMSVLNPKASGRKVTRCRIFDNTSVGDGAGVYMDADGTIDHCTIFGNKSASGIGSGIELSTGTLKNSIVFGNGVVSGYNADNIRCTGSGVVTTTCTQPAVTGTGNTDLDPLFMDASKCNFALRPGSPCIGTGLDGDVACDMGAIPYATPTSPVCSFTISKSVLEQLETVTLQAYGACTEGLTYAWDLDNDGEYDDATGATVDWKIKSYGAYTVSVALVDGSGVPQAMYKRENVLLTKVPKAYVNEQGSDTFPYATKETGAHTLEAAMDAIITTVEKPGEIVVCDGTYQVQGAAVKVLLPMKITSENGPSKTFLQGWYKGSAKGDHRVMIVDHAQAYVSGITMEKGNWYSYTYGDEGAGGLRLISGTVTNCVIRNNDGSDTGGGVNLRGGLLTHCEIYGNVAYRGNNTAAASAGGVYMIGGEMNDCVISNNAACNGNGGCGVKMTGGTIRRCLIADNVGKRSSTAGIGLCMSGGSVERCRILGNGVRSSSYSNHGGGVKISGGTLRNCLIAGNKTTTRSAGVHQTGGTVENCTIVGNACSASTGSGLYLDGNNAVARNNIIYGNGLGVASEPLCNIEFSSAKTFTKNIVAPATAGTDNVNADPLYKDAPNGDYRLGAGSPAIDTATDLGLTEDLEGNRRPKDGNGDGVEAPDMGCYEAADASEGPLECSIDATVKVGYDSVSTRLAASVSGSGSKGELHYEWNVGKGVIAGETDAKEIDVTYSDYGYHTVTLTVTAEGGKSASKTVEKLISVGTRRAHVNTTGDGTWPYATPETGTNDIAHVLATAILDSGTLYEIEVDDGEFPINDKWLILSGRVRIYSKHGAAFSALKAANPEYSDKRKLVHLNNPDAVVEGLTLKDGWWDLNRHSDDGGVIRVTQGTLRNCVIRDSLGGDNAGGADILGGTVSNCVFYNCESYRNSNAFGNGRGGGFTVSGPAIVADCLVSNCYCGVFAGGIWLKHKDAVVSNCVVTGCKAAYTKRYNKSMTNDNDTYYSGGVLVDSGLLANVEIRDCYAYNRIGGLRLTSKDAKARNVLVANCSARVLAQGVWMSAGTMENCTVAGNGPAEAADVAAATLSGGTMVNCIVAGNAGCATQLAPGAATVSFTYTGDAPRFKSPAKGDWRLAGSSPCLNAGTKLDWMTDDATDLAGNPRILGKRPDLGCYECQPGGLLLIVR